MAGTVFVILLAEQHFFVPLLEADDCPHPVGSTALSRTRRRTGAGRRRCSMA
jgi:hypothetical protein